MALVVVGMSHHTAPVDILEKMSLPPDRVPDCLDLLMAQSTVDEAMVISTCNRVEVYAVTSTFHAGIGDIVTVLESLTGLDPATLRQNVAVHYGSAAAEHLLSVAAGLDSMVLGEQQIIGQVRNAYEIAASHGTTGSTLHVLAQCALRTGKRVHTETGIDAAGASLVDVALSQGLSLTGRKDYSGATALIFGAGAMASLAATKLGKMGVKKLLIANRTADRAEILATHSWQAGVPATAVPFDEALRRELISEADVVVSATGAGMFVVTPEHCVPGRSVVAVDLSLPRDIDPAVAAVPGCTLVNLDHISTLDRGLTAQARAEALSIVAEELGTFTSQERVKDVVPAVKALRGHANELVTKELLRLESRTPDMSDKDRDKVEETVHRIVEKLLHEPTVKVKELAVTSGSVNYTSALQELFGLNDASVRRGSSTIHISPANLFVKPTHRPSRAADGR